VIQHAEVVVPASFSDKLKREISGRANLTEVASAQAIGPGMSSTGELEGELYGQELKEQALMVDVAGGVAVVTGCAHPGLGRILDLATSTSEVAAVVGGFHGFKDLDRLAAVDLIVPCHCTVNKNAILEKYPASARRGGVGLQLEIP
jgi:7,8-dihydropterin-6-yl-methyl-4-(beta-D-ribofuranosyl)aminobenzene 5'-phosphate synthase